MTVSGVEDRALVLHTGERLRPEDTEGWRILAASDGHVVIDIDTAAALVAVAPEAVTGVREMLDALVADPGSRRCLRAAPPCVSAPTGERSEAVCSSST